MTHAQQINEGDYESSIPLFEDIVYAFERVEIALQGLDAHMISSEAQAGKQQIVKGLDAAVHAYEMKSFGKVKEVLQFTLIPSFAKWHDQLGRDFAKYFSH